MKFIASLIVCLTANEVLATDDSFGEKRQALCANDPGFYGSLYEPRMFLDLYRNQSNEIKHGFSANMMASNIGEYGDLARLNLFKDANCSSDDSTMVGPGYDWHESSSHENGSYHI